MASNRGNGGRSENAAAPTTGAPPVQSPQRPGGTVAATSGPSKRTTLCLNDSIAMASNTAANTAKQAKARRALSAAVALCFCFMVAEGAVGFISHSLAVLTDAAHMLTDVGALLLALLAIHASGWGASSKYTYGWKRAEVLGALGSIFTIWALVGGIIIEAIRRIVSTIGCAQDQTEGSCEAVDPKMMCIIGCCGLASNFMVAAVLAWGGHHGHSHFGGGDHGHAHGAGGCGGGHGGHDDHDDHGHSHGGHDDHADHGHSHGAGGGCSGHDDHGDHGHAHGGAGDHHDTTHDDHGDHGHSHGAGGGCSGDHGHSRGGNPDAHGHSHGNGASHDEDHDDAEPDERAPLRVSNGHQGHGDHGHGDEGHDSHGKSKTNMNIRGAFLHALGDCIQSVGVIVAAAIIWSCNVKWHGSPASAHSYFNLADPACSILFGVVTLFTTVNLFKELFNILMESTPSSIDFDLLLTELEELPGVESVHDLHVWSLSGDAMALSAHIVSNRNGEVLHAAQKVFKRHGIAHTTIQIDPSENSPCCVK